MRNRVIGLLCLMAMLGMSSCERSGWSLDESKPVTMLRFRSTNTESDEEWAKTFAIIKENPGCCDEVWFSTGVVIPPLEWHQEQADRMAKAKEQLKGIGVESSLQFQMTLGHGDEFANGREPLFSEKRWTGFTGSTGVEDQYCNCPRQTAFLEYVRQVTHIYASALHPRYMWIDDDLRCDNHRPATNGSLFGCWCETCIAAFNAEQGTEWTRETLAEALPNDGPLSAQWRSFSIRSIVEVARVIAEETHKVSPETKMGYQYFCHDYEMEQAQVVLATMHEATGNPVGYRAAGGAYYDLNGTADQVIVAMNCARCIKLMGNPDYVDLWCPEVETWPRVYGSRTPQSMLVQGFASLAYGMNAVSMFIMAADKEDYALYSHSLLKPLAAGAPFLRGYAEANKGTVPVGYEYETAVPDHSLYDFGRSGIPVLPGMGKSLGKLSNRDLSRYSFTNQVSTYIQTLREEINDRCPSPAVCCAPFVGLVIPRVSEENGALKTVGLMNVRIDSQYAVRLRLDGLSKEVKTATWYEMKKKPVRLPIQWEGDIAYVEVSEIAACNVGYVRFE